MEAKVETLRNQRRKRFMTRGITFAVASGICYGLYTGFLTLAETQGVWGDWFAGTEWGNGNAALNAFTITFTLAALALTTCSAAYGRSRFARRTGSLAISGKPLKPSRDA